MKKFLITAVSCISLSIALGQGNKLQIGASLGTNLSGIRNGVNYFGAETSPQIGWSAGATIAYQPAPRFRLAGYVGGMSEGYRTEGPTEYEYNYSWGEGTATFSYLPFSSKKFDLFFGTGFSARRVMTGTAGGQITFSDGSTAQVPSSSMLDRIYPWTYLLPFTIGTSLNLSSAGSILISIEYQLGLRDRLKPLTATYPGVDTAYLNGNERLYSICLKVAFLLSLTADKE